MNGKRPIAVTKVRHRDGWQTAENGILSLA